MKFEMRHLAFLSTLIIAFGSVVPIPNTPGGEEARTVAHTIIYLTCSFSWSHSKISKRKFILLMAALIPLTEILQLPLSYRNPSIGDLIANIVGTIIGYLISLFPKNF